MDLVLLGWPEDGPTLDLDHECFAYAGNFRTGRTGIAVVIDEERDAGPPCGEADATASDAVDSEVVLAAASFDEDRAATDALRVRYISVRSDWQGEGLGPRLLAFVVERARERGFERVRIGVNNPIAFRTAYRAGFGFTGEESGLGELVLEAPPPDDRSAVRYRAGLDRFGDRELPDHQRAILDRHSDGDPPAVVDRTFDGGPERGA